jgi:hypothetical protein
MSTWECSDLILMSTWECSDLILMSTMRMFWFDINVYYENVLIWY